MSNKGLEMLGKLFIVSLWPLVVGASPQALPASIKESMNQTYPGSTIIEVDTQDRDHMTAFEIKLVTTDDHILDVLFAPDGTVVEVKEIVPKSTLATPADTTMKKESKGGVLKKVEKMEVHAGIRNGAVIRLEKLKTYYEGELLVNGQSHEILVDAQDGAIVWDSRVASSRGEPLDATPSVNDLLKEKDVWIGVETETLDYTTLKTLNLSHGLRITKVHPASPAETAKMVSGDILLQVERTQLETTKQFTQLIETYSAGSILKCKIFRKGNTQEVTVIAHPRPEPEEPALPTREEGR